MNVRAILSVALLSTPITMLVTIEPSLAGDTLPIKRGYYVWKETPCSDASNATIRLYDGMAFGEAHLQCRNASSRKLKDGSCEIVQQCQDSEGRGTAWKRRKSAYRVTGESDFIDLNAPAPGAFRYCRQADLPEPWAGLDLKAIGVQ